MGRCSPGRLAVPNSTVVAEYTMWRSAKNILFGCVCQNKLFLCFYVCEPTSLRTNRKGSTDKIFFIFLERVVQLAWNQFIMYGCVRTFNNNKSVETKIVPQEAIQQS